VLAIGAGEDLPAGAVEVGGVAEVERHGADVDALLERVSQLRTASDRHLTDAPLDLADRPEAHGSALRRGDGG
jgi:hypothetical protein